MMVKTNGQKRKQKQKQNQMRRRQPKRRIAPARRRNGRPRAITRASIPAARVNRTRVLGPTQRGLAGGGIAVSHREFIGEVSTTSTGLDKVFSALINPANAALHPWVSNIAGNYQYYRLKRLRVSFVTTLGTDNPGSIHLMGIPDPTDTVPTTKVQVLAAKGTISGPIYANLSYVFNSPSKGKKRYVDASATVPPIPTTNTRYDQYPGSIVVYVSGVSDGTAHKMCGDLYADYEYEFLHPYAGSTPEGSSFQGRTTADSWHADDVREWLKSLVDHGSFSKVGKLFNDPTIFTTTPLLDPGLITLVSGALHTYMNYRTRAAALNDMRAETFKTFDHFVIKEAGVWRISITTVLRQTSGNETGNAALLLPFVDEWKRDEEGKNAHDRHGKVEYLSYTSECSDEGELFDSVPVFITTDFVVKTAGHVALAVIPVNQITVEDPSGQTDDEVITISASSSQGFSNGYKMFRQGEPFYLDHAWTDSDYDFTTSAFSNDCVSLDITRLDTAGAFENFVPTTDGFGLRVHIPKGLTPFESFTSVKEHYQKMIAEVEEKEKHPMQLAYEESIRRNWLRGTGARVNHSWLHLTDDASKCVACGITAERDTPEYTEACFYQPIQTRGDLTGNRAVINGNYAVRPQPRREMPTPNVHGDDAPFRRHQRSISGPIPEATELRRSDSRASGKNYEDNFVEVSEYAPFRTP
jgi:hypothetical protein